MKFILQDEYKNIISCINLEKIYNKSFLITGANGLIGSYLVDFLDYINEKFHTNVKIYAMSRSKEKLVARFKNTKTVNLLEQDLSEPINEKVYCDYIIHLASNAHPRAYAQCPVDTMKTNILGTINLLEMAKEVNAKFLYISSGEIYGNNIDHYFTEDDLGLIDSKSIRACYPESKRAAETLCMAYNAQYGVVVNVARLCYVYGGTITDTNSRADAQFLRNVINVENIVMKSEGKQRRTYCYVADAVSALITILLEGKSPEVYNVANMNSIVSLREYAQTLADIANVELKFELPDEVEVRGFSKPADSILDSTKLLKLGWQPKYTIKEGLEHTYNIKKELRNENIK